MSIVTLNNRALKDATAVGTTTSLGNLVFISRSTASSSSSVNITSGIDSTYKDYIFIFNNIHPQTDEKNFVFNLSVDGGSNYNVTKTTTMFYAEHREDDSATQFAYETGSDLAQSTTEQLLNFSHGNGSDESSSGELFLFNPSSTTFVKHFIARGNVYHYNNRSLDSFVAGYFNTTSAIDAIKFQQSSGNIDSGTIKLYGIKDS